jgi:hypothetical protein
MIWAAMAASSEAKGAMLFSESIVKVFIATLLCFGQKPSEMFD